MNILGSLTATMAPPTSSRRAALAIAMLLEPLVADSRAQSPLSDSFNPVTLTGQEWVGAYSLAVQPDGKILVDGAFTALSGWPHRNVGRLNPDGTVDATFNPSTNFDATSLALQADGKVLVGGFFTSLNGVPRNHLGRLNADGSLDATFNSPPIGGENFLLSLQADGKILVAGRLFFFGGQRRFPLARLNPNGRLDTTFIQATFKGVYDEVGSLALQADGKILVGKSFTTPGLGNMVFRLNVDGTPDPTFNSGANGPVTSMALQADGKILVGGHFTSLGGQPREKLGRLNPDGTQDATFNPGVNGPVNSMALQADGKILVGGHFNTLGGQPREGLGRLNPDGTLDATFRPEKITLSSLGYIMSMCLQTDGKILLGGEQIVRLDNTGPATHVLSHDGSSITWMRGGTSPEIWRTTFESSVDGLNWSAVGVGTRIPGGWELAGASIPSAAILRARGYVAGGDNASAWFAESTLMAPPVLIGLDLVGDGVDITVSSVAGRYYTLQTAATLDAWVDVAGAVAVHGTGAVIRLHHAASAARQNFYRVVVRLSP